MLSLFPPLTMLPVYHTCGTEPLPQLPKSPFSPETPKLCPQPAAKTLGRDPCWALILLQAQCSLGTIHPAAFTSLFLALGYRSCSPLNASAQEPVLPP